MIKLGQAYNVIRLGKLIPSCSGHNQQNTGVYKSAAEVICVFVFVTLTDPLSKRRITALRQIIAKKEMAEEIN